MSIENSSFRGGNAANSWVYNYLAGNSVAAQRLCFEFGQKAKHLPNKTNEMGTLQLGATK